MAGAPTPGIWAGGQYFGGPVLTQDQLTATGLPSSYFTALPKGTPFQYGNAGGYRYTTADYDSNDFSLKADQGLGGTSPLSSLGFDYDMTWGGMPGGTPADLFYGNQNYTNWAGSTGGGDFITRALDQGAGFWAPAMAFGGYAAGLYGAGAGTAELMGPSAAELGVPGATGYATPYGGSWGGATGLTEAGLHGPSAVELGVPGATGYSTPELMGPSAVELGVPGATGYATPEMELMGPSAYEMGVPGATGYSTLTGGSYGGLDAAYTSGLYGPSAQELGVPGATGYSTPAGGAVGPMATVANAPGSMWQDIWRRYKEAQKYMAPINIANGLYGMYNANKMTGMARDQMNAVRDVINRTTTGGTTSINTGSNILTGLEQEILDLSTGKKSAITDADIQAVNRGMAAGGYLGSGNQMTALREASSAATNARLAQLRDLMSTGGALVQSGGSTMTAPLNAGTNAVSSYGMGMDLASRALASIGFGALGMIGDMYAS